MPGIVLGIWNSSGNRTGRSPFITSGAYILVREET